MIYIRKKTHEEYVNELKEKNPNVEVLEEYINASTKIKHRCLIDGYEWMAKPNGILVGYGCPKCGKNARKTTESYKEEIKMKHLNIEVLGDYKNAHTHILHKCIDCGYEWDSMPENILKSKGCPKCSGYKKKTHEEYVDDLMSVNPDIEVLEPYINAKTPILHYCNKHDYTWKTTPSNLLNGSGCPECGNEKIREKNKKTHDEYIRDLSVVNKNIIVIEQYINANTPILHKCSICGNEWNAQPGNVLSGTGCPKCGIKKNTIARTKTHEEFVGELLRKNPDIKVLGKYINSQTKILCKCLKDGYEWESVPSSLLSGCGCPECGKKKATELRRKSQQEYIDELKRKNPFIEVADSYINSDTKILHHCLIHDIYYKTTPVVALQGHGCPSCASEKLRKYHTKTNEQYISELKNISPFIIPLEKYIDSQTSILHFCTKHNIKWSSCPNSLLQGYGCPQCRIERLSNAHKKTHLQYIKDVSVANPDVEVIGEYIDSKTPILHKCLRDNCEWYVKPTYILSGKNGCPQCNESKGERCVRQWLEKHDFYYKPQMAFDDCRDILPMPYDFYLPKRNLCIEYDGEGHYAPVFGMVSFMATILHDGMKNNYCKWNGIELLRIPYFRNIEDELDKFLLN